MIIIGFFALIAVFIEWSLLRKDSRASEFLIHIFKIVKTEVKLNFKHYDFKAARTT